MQAGRPNHTLGKMKLDSKYHDMIRIRSRKAGEAKREQHPQCSWKGCTAPGRHRAPRGRGHDGEYYLFCTEHVAKYNSSYNYFDGMSDVEVESFHKDATYGHRPTWKSGANSWAQGSRAPTSEAEQNRFADARTQGARGFYAWRATQPREASRRTQRKLKPLEAKALDTLGLTAASSKDEIKARYKELVKQHHPDANGGDRGTEEKLREIIQAYNYLKQVGLG